jgi:exopolysaccharide biosynthesis protein
MYHHHDWSKYDFVLCCGPRLVTDGVVDVEPSAEGFHDAHMLNRNGRVAVGVTASNRLIFVVTRKPVYLSALARAMKDLGVTNAINLDGGSSIGLYYKGSVLIRPSRQLTNLVLVYDDRWRYEEVKEQLLPIDMRSAHR